MIFLNVFQVGQLREVSNKANNAELKLYLEVEFGLVMDYCLLIFLFRVRKFCLGKVLYFCVCQVLSFAIFWFVYSSGFATLSSTWEDQRRYSSIFQTVWPSERGDEVFLPASLLFEILVLKEQLFPCLSNLWSLNIISKWKVHHLLLTLRACRHGRDVKRDNLGNMRLLWEKDYFSFNTVCSLLYLM